MKRRIGLILTAAALVLSLASCEALYSAFNGNAAWSFDFAGTQWVVTETDDTIQLNVFTYDATSGDEISDTESLVPVTEIQHVISIDRKAIGEDNATWTYRTRLQFNEGFAGPYTDTLDGSSNPLDDYSSFPTISDYASTPQDLVTAEGHTYAGFGGAVLQEVLITGIWDKYTNDAGETCYILTVTRMVTRTYKYDSSTADTTTTLAGMTLVYTDTENYDPNDPANTVVLEPKTGYDVSGMGSGAVLKSFNIPGVAAVDEPDNMKPGDVDLDE